MKKRLGHCKAFELLLSEEEIIVKDAQELGVVNKVIPLDSLVISTLEMARAFAKKSSAPIKVIKRLLNYPEQNMADYLEYENHELMRILGCTTNYNHFSPWA